VWPFCAATWRGVHPSCSDKVSLTPSKYVTGSWKTYLLGTSKLSKETQLKTSVTFLKLVFLHIWIKQLLNFLAVKFYTHSKEILKIISNQKMCPKGRFSKIRSHILYLILSHVPEWAVFYTIVHASLFT